MVTVVEVTGVVLPAVAAASFAALLWRARRIDEPGVGWFRVLLALFALVTVSLSVLVVGLPAVGFPGDVAEAIRMVAFLLYITAIVPWFLFALEYTGRVSDVSPLVAAALGAPLLAFAYNLLVRLDGVAIPDVAVIAHFVEIAWLGYAGLLGIGSYQILRTTHRYGHLSLRQGAVLVAAMIVPLFGQRFAVALRDQPATALDLTTGMAVAYLLVAGLLGLAVFRFDVFDSTPAAGNIGERAIARDTDDLIVVTDHRNRIITVNEAAAAALGVTKTAHHGDRIDEFLGLDVDELEARQTVELQTAEGRRQFDAQVSHLTDQHDRWLGYLVSLRDVTDREIRKQRLEVLNRVLRHNLRNELNVVKTRASAVASELDDAELSESLEIAIDQVDHLTALGERANEIETLMADVRDGAGTEDDGTESAVDLGSLVEDVAATARERSPTATISVSAPGDVAVRTNAAVVEFALRNVVENAVEHSSTSPDSHARRDAVDHDSTSPDSQARQDALGHAGREDQHVEIVVSADERATEYPVRIEVRDDGPGIPDHEIAVVERGYETVLEHGSGLGLWVTNWALSEVGGELSFDDREPTGAVVTLSLPHAPVETESEDEFSEGKPVETKPDANP